jgi:alpha-L-fucosidase 2
MKVVYSGLICFALGATGWSMENVLWYRQPASVWEEALPVGNGRLGAMVHGGIKRELLELNDDTIWSRGSLTAYDRAGAYRYLPEIRELLFAGRYHEADALCAAQVLGRRPLGAYQPLGDLVLEFSGLNNPCGYRRELDLDAAVARTMFRDGNALFTREVFVSAPQNVLVVRLSCSEPGRISLKAGLSRSEGAVCRPAKGAGIILQGRADEGKLTAGVEFAAQLVALPEGGTSEMSGGFISIRSADAVTLMLTSETGFRFGGDLETELSRRLDQVVKMDYPLIRDEHIADHRRYFRRAALTLGSCDDSAAVPTDERIARIKGGAKDPGLFALMFQFGRYLLIGSSRPGSMAANLQGLWNRELDPPWFSGYHFNINVQMNYWLADITNLGELNQPLFDLIDRVRENGRKTAREVYNCRGFVVAHRTNLDGFTSPVTGLNIWPAGAGWLCQHLWEHYLFTLDKEFLLNRAYPSMKEAAEFYLDWLTVHPETGLLVSGPSISCENRFLLPDGSSEELCMAPAMDQQIAAELFKNCLEAAALLGISDPFVAEVKEKRARLASGTKIGSDGRLMEWADEYPEKEPGHRHISHLYALYPGRVISPRSSPELADAAARSLSGRESAGAVRRITVGWSTVWHAACWARLGNGSKAYESAETLLKQVLFPNLLSYYQWGTPPVQWRDRIGVFQIDANLGFPAAVAEMLMQSHPGEVELLPALPAEWPDGSVRGLCARGGFVVDMEWGGGLLRKAVVYSSRGGDCLLRYGERTVHLTLGAGETCEMDAFLKE